MTEVEIGGELWGAHSTPYGVFWVWRVPLMKQEGDMSEERFYIRTRTISQEEALKMWPPNPEAPIPLIDRIEELEEYVGRATAQRAEEQIRRRSNGRKSLIDG